MYATKQFRDDIIEAIEKAIGMPRRDRSRLVRSVMHRRHPAVPGVDWSGMAGQGGPIPYRAARVLALRTDTPAELLRRALAEHPELAPLVPDPPGGLRGPVRPARTA